MIGYLYGKVIEKKPPTLLLDVGGVGYEIHAPMSTFAHLPETQQTTTLYTHLLIRDENQLLFGFSDKHQRRLFRHLIRVSGIGPKMAVTILSSIEPNEFVQCIAEDNTQYLTQLPGIGKKVAERLIIEMRDRLKDWSPQDTSLQGPLQAAGQASDAVHEAIDALVALGYKPQEAKRAVAKAAEKGQDNSEALIRAALRAS